MTLGWTHYIKLVSFPLSINTDNMQGKERCSLLFLSPWPLSSLRSDAGPKLHYLTIKRHPPFRSGSSEGNEA